VGLSGRGVSMLNLKILPANCGDSIIISFNDGDEIKNILIDGGVGSIYDDILKDEIIKIKDSNQKMDLLIVTHTDDDHIKGIIKFIEDDTLNDCIEEVWFNSWSNFGGKEVKLLHQGKEISAKSARTLENKLKEMNIWNNKLIHQGIYKNYNKAKITVVSPNEEALNKLRDYLKPESNISKDNRKKSIKFLQKREFKEDKAIPNGSSIAFIFEYKDKKLLFTGDGFPSIVLEGLEKMNFIDDTKKLKLDYIKLSHHAGKKNTSDEFLKKIECNNYIVTTQGCNGKPNKETFARILKYHQPLNLYFNYKNTKTQNIFFKDELEEYQITQRYLEENPTSYTIEVC
jgi:beta-lactamase superfamily II metal-dependent hydrolase